MKAILTLIALACVVAGCAHRPEPPSVASVMQADRDFAARAAAAGLQAAFVEYAAPDAVIFRAGVGPIRGSAAIGEALAGTGNETLAWEPAAADVATSGDLAYTWGWYTFTAYGRGQLVCDPWHYLPVLEKKPGALRHGASFVTWDLPLSIKLVRDRVLKQDKGDRAFVDLLLMARDLGDGGLDALEVACDLTLQTGIISAAIVLNEMRRLTEATRPPVLTEKGAKTPALTVEPMADCSRYDSLRSANHVH